MRKVVLGLVGLILSGQAVLAECAVDKVKISGDFGQVQFTVEVADDNAERAQGLMNRESMPRTAGMLFVFQQPKPVAFWMKNTLIPLDMIFAGPDGVIQRIHENAVPQDLTPIPGGDAIQYVLEINGGLAKSYGLAEGDVLQHPAIDPAVAAAPCPIAEAAPVAQ